MLNAVAIPYDPRDLPRRKNQCPSRNASAYYYDEEAVNFFARHERLRVEQFGYTLLVSEPAESLNATPLGAVFSKTVTD